MWTKTKPQLTPYFYVNLSIKKHDSIVYFIFFKWKTKKFLSNSIIIGNIKYSIKVLIFIINREKGSSIPSKLFCSKQIDIIVDSVALIFTIWEPYD